MITSLKKLVKNYTDNCNRLSVINQHIKYLELDRDKLQQSINLLLDMPFLLYNNRRNGDDTINPDEPLNSQFAHNDKYLYSLDKDWSDFYKDNVSLLPNISGRSRPAFRSLTINNELKTILNDFDEEINHQYNQREILQKDTEVLFILIKKIEIIIDIGIKYKNNKEYIINKINKLLNTYYNNKPISKKNILHYFNTLPKHAKDNPFTNYRKVKRLYKYLFDKDKVSIKRIPNDTFQFMDRVLFETSKCLEEKIGKELNMNAKNGLLTKMYNNHNLFIPLSEEQYYKENFGYKLLPP